MLTGEVTSVFSASYFPSKEITIFTLKTGGSGLWRLLPVEQFRKLGFSILFSTLFLTKIGLLSLSLKTKLKASGSFLLLHLPAQPSVG